MPGAVIGKALNLGYIGLAFNTALSALKYSYCSEPSMQYLFIDNSNISSLVPKFI